MGILRRGRLRACFALTAALAALAVMDVPGRAAESITCAHEELGPTGSAGDVLRIEDATNTSTHIYRDGDAIIVSSNAIRGPIACSGEAPTVFNIDRIEYATTNSAPFISHLGDGPLAPGATPEPQGSEIEIHVSEAYQPEVVNVAGTATRDLMFAGLLRPRRIGVNVNAQLDGDEADADVILDVRRASEATVKLKGGGGDDTLSALGAGPFRGPIPTKAVALNGGPGDDRLIGGPYRDRINGHTGDDTLIAGRGRDRITIGPGRDIVKAGKGPDEVFNVSDVGGLPPDLRPDRVDAGPGDDLVDVAQLLRGDVVRCGSGRDRSLIDPGDRTAGCERTTRR